MKANPLKFASYKTAIVELKGGVNENVSSLELNAGELIDCKNYMIAEGGYGGYVSTKGFEAIDGKTLPSEYVSLLLIIENCSVGINSGEIITGFLSGATAVALEDSVILSGALIDGDATLRVQARIATLSFTPPEVVSTVGGNIGTLTLREELVGGTDTYNLGITYAYSIVNEVPGEGDILGLHIYEGKMYAWRKKVSVAFIGMYVEHSTTGWVEIDTSANPLAYVSGAHEFHFTNYNFSATTDAYSMYWCDGVNKARVYDGTTVSVIDNAGMNPNDKPINIIAHNMFLYLAYRGGSLQQSVVGEPNNWIGSSGATEYGLGNEITNLEVGVQSSLIIFLREGIRILAGNALDNLTMETFSRLSGAYPRSSQRLLGTVFFLDDRGVTTMEAVQEYGDYAANSISQRFKQTLFKNGHELTATVTSRDLNQFRLFFDDRLGVYVSFEGKEFRGATIVEFNKVVRTVSQGEDVDGKELIIFSSDDGSGYVYKMDSGTSFNGSPITCRMTLPYYHYGSPRSWKAFKRATLEISGDDGQTFDMKVDFDYSEAGFPRTIWYEAMVYTSEGGAIYGESKWGIMKYGIGSAATNRVAVYLKGIGTNMSYKLISNETYRGQHIVQNIITDYELLSRRI